MHAGKDVNVAGALSRQAFNFQRRTIGIDPGIDRGSIPPRRRVGAIVGNTY